MVGVDASTSRGPERRPLVLIAEPIDAECVSWLGERAEVRVLSPGDAGFDGALREAKGLVVRTYVRVDVSVLARAPRLRVVARAGVGLDNIDQPACAARGIAVVSTPGANTDAVVEFVVGEILDRLRPRPVLTTAVGEAEWHRIRAAAVAPGQFRDLTLGILGMGRIGRALARVSAAMGVATMYHDLVEIEAEHRHGASPTSLGDLLSRSDVLSIHVDGRPSNRGLLGAGRLRLLRPGVLLINTARGMVLDHAALADHLRRDPSARAVLDVHEPEPIGPDNPLLGLSSARLTPHIASATATAKRAMSWVVRDLWEVLSQGESAA